MFLGLIPFSAILRNNILKVDKNKVCGGEGGHI